MRKNYVVTVSGLGKIEGHTIVLADCAADAIRSATEEGIRPQDTRVISVVEWQPIDARVAHEFDSESQNVLVASSPEFEKRLTDLEANIVALAQKVSRLGLSTLGHSATKVSAAEETH